MKRILLLFATALFLVSPSGAQTLKVDVQGIKKNIEKSNADIEHEKRNTRANTWINRGKIFFKAASEPTNGLFQGMERPQLELMYGKPSVEKTTDIAGTEVEELTYDNFIVYLLGNAVYSWTQTLEIEPNALETAFDAYAKAYELDAKSEANVKTGIMEIADQYKQIAQNLFDLQKLGDSGDAFLHSYQVQMHPAVNVIDTASIYNAGFLNTFAQKFDKGIESLELAKKYEYESDGDLYYYMFHCYYGLEDNVSAKNILTEGIARYPGNTRIVEGLLGIYTTTEEGDPKEIIPIVEKSIADDPENIELWNGLGRIYDQLGDEDKSIESFEHAVGIDPLNFSTNFNLGFMYIKKGDRLNKELNEAPQTSQKAYNDGLKEVNIVYGRSIEPLEKAHLSDPTNAATVELLKNVTFRLRDEDSSIAEKFQKYDEMFRQMSGAE